MINFGIVELYCGASGKKGFYNNQEIGLAKAMKKIGYSCFIFYPDKEIKDITEEVIEDGIKIIRCPAKVIGVHSKYDLRILDKYKIQVVQLGADNQLFSPSVLKYCDRHKIAIYNYIGTVGTDSDNVVKKILMNILYKRNITAYKVHKNFVKTVCVKKLFEKHGLNECEIAPVGLDMTIIPQKLGEKEQIKKACGIPIDKKILLYVGRIDSYKQPDKMLILLKNLSEQYYGVIIGDGLLSPQIKKMIYELNLESRLKWIKKIENNEIHKYYFMADYFLNFNKKEIFGMSILEAMYQGCIVIAHHAPGPDMIIENGISGYLVDDMKTMRQIIINNESESIDTNLIKQRIVNYFTWEKTAKIFDNWIRSVINE